MRTFLRKGGHQVRSHGGECLGVGLVGVVEARRVDKINFGTIQVKVEYHDVRGTWYHFL